MMPDIAQSINSANSTGEQQIGDKVMIPNHVYEDDPGKIDSDKVEQSVAANLEVSLVRSRTILRNNERSIQ